MEPGVNKISIVVPVYNASKVLYNLQKEVDSVFAGLNMTYQLVLVDDFSRDDSWAVIRDIKEKNPAKVVAIRMARNFGQHNAIFCGLRFCTGDFVVTMDDDMQHPPSEIPKLLAKQKEKNADVVYGTSKDYKKPLFRRMISKGFNSTSKYSDGMGVGSPFRLMKKELVKKLVSHTQYFVFLDDIISWYSHNIDHVDVRHDHSQVKKSRYNAGSLMNLYYEISVGHNAVPLKFITWMGFMSAFISFAVAAIFIVRKLFFHVRVGYTGIIVSIMFTAGVILFSIGFIGEHLRRMYNILNAQPQYSVAEVLE